MGQHALLRLFSGPKPIWSVVPKGEKDAFRHLRDVLSGLLMARWYFLWVFGEKVWQMTAQIRGAVRARASDKAIVGYNLLDRPSTQLVRAKKQRGGAGTRRKVVPRCFLVRESVDSGQKRGQPVEFRRLRGWNARTTPRVEEVGAKKQWSIRFYA